MSALSCADCGKDVTPRNAWREVTGWTQPRAQGGTNHIKERRDTGRFLCGTCMVELEQGAKTRQESLL